MAFAVALAEFFPLSERLLHWLFKRNISVLRVPIRTLVCFCVLASDTHSQSLPANPCACVSVCVFAFRVHLPDPHCAFLLVSSSRATAPMAIAIDKPNVAGPAGSPQIYHVISTIKPLDQPSKLVPKQTPSCRLIV